jgi:hypothetical protein
MVRGEEGLELRWGGGRGVGEEGAAEDGLAAGGAGAVDFCGLGSALSRGRSGYAPSSFASSSSCVLRSNIARARQTSTTLLILFWMSRVELLYAMATASTMI